MAVPQAADKNSPPEARSIRHLSPGENRRLLRRIDLILMPMMFDSYGLQYMDKAILGAASQVGVVEEVGLYDVTMSKGFSLATLVFCLGFAAGASFFSSRFPIGIFCETSVFAPGLVTMAAALADSYSSMIALRFFVGFVEAAIPAAFSHTIAMWYKPDEQAFLESRLLPGNIHCYENAVISCFCSVLQWTESTLAKQQQRMRASSFIRSVKNPKTRAYLFVSFSCQLVNGAVSGFGPIIISSFGLDPLQSVLIAGSLGGTLFLSLLAAGYVYDNLVKMNPAKPANRLISSFIPNQKCHVAFATCLPIIIGRRGCLLTYHFVVGVFDTPYVMVLSLVTANTAGQTKKAVVTGLVWFAYWVSNGVAPLLVRSTEQSQHYPSLFIPIVSLLSVGLLVLVASGWYLGACNKTREGDNFPNRRYPQSFNKTASLDFIDQETPNFRYYL
ncbi:unnamed protein product [Clonostachys rosea]|uniref:Major facilitator superfamily (MFS) profile domain-containing protein n=1 Tax=Bionectria ochroleuca TaxID=29856 RepID=A0ABY6UQL7_BIOOC|nr:unnamed protein product [Clonostachys rosea]